MSESIFGLNNNVFSSTFEATLFLSSKIYIMTKIYNILNPNLYLIVINLIIQIYITDGLIHLVIYLINVFAII
mgnify:CR=1 FL=1